MDTIVDFVSLETRSLVKPNRSPYWVTVKSLSSMRCSKDPSWEGVSTPVGWAQGELRPCTFHFGIISSCSFWCKIKIGGDQSMSQAFKTPAETCLQHNIHIQLDAIRSMEHFPSTDHAVKYRQ
jgi:hypothetical protein